MKRVINGLIVFVIILCSGLILASCGKAEDLITLDDPTGIAYDESTKKVSWNFVEHADYYEVSFDEGTASEVRTNSVTYSATKEEFTFFITAKSNSVYQDSNTVSMAFAKLNSSITLTVNEDGLVEWDAVDGATGYEVQIDGRSVGTVPTTEYSDVESGKAHTISVKPVKEGTAGVYYYASWCPTITVNKLNQVSIDTISYTDGMLKWNAVASAVKYKVNINGTDYETTKNQLQYDAKSEAFSVTVQAIGNHESTYNGAISAQKSFVYLSVVEGITVEDGILKWNEVEGATGYQVKLYGQTSSPLTVNSNQYEGLSSGTQYNVSILPVAERKDTSYFSDWCTTVPVSILTVPQVKWTAGVDVDGIDAVNALNWNQVSNASGYQYSVTLPDGSVDSGTLGNATNFYSSAFSMVGAYVIRVKATANGSAGIYDSAYSEPITVVRLSAPSISTERISSTAYSLANGFRVSFDQVSGASGYQLYKDGTSVMNSTTPQFVYADLVPASNLRETKIAFYVQSMGNISPDGKTINLSSMTGDNSPSSAFTITVLASPMNPTIEGFQYQFTGTANTYGYNISINNDNKTSMEETYDLSELRSSTYDVKVCSMGNGKEILPSNYSTSITVSRLNAPYNLTVSTDESDGVLGFDGDDRALSYSAYITGQQEALPVDTTTNVKQYISTQATIIVMYSIANEFKDTEKTIYHMTSPASSNYTFFKLEAPNNINFNDTDMTWNGPSNLNASAAYTPTYKIVDGARQTVYNGSFSGLSYPLATLEGGNAYSFGIIAIGDGSHYVNSDMAYSREIMKLETPELTINQNSQSYEWMSVSGASGYVLSIDGVIVSNGIHISGNVYSYSPTYIDLGNHSVILYATGDHGVSTINSMNFEYTQLVKQLTTPSFSYSYNSDYYVDDGQINIKITTTSTYCTGYYYIIGGTSHLSPELGYSFIPNTSGKIDISVYAKGGGFDETGVYYSDSQESAVKTLTLLGYPSSETFEVNQDGVISWGKVNAASGYICTLTITTITGEEYTINHTINTNTAQWNISKGVNTGETTILWNNIKYMTLTIQAKGNMTMDKEMTINGSITSAPSTKEWTSAFHE